MTRALRLIGLVLVFFVSAELACRFEEWVRFGTPWLSPAASLNDLLARDRDGAHGRRNAVFQKWRMNGLGLRGPDADSVPATGTLRVVTAGASEAFGVHESPGREFPRQMEDSLAGRLTAGRCDAGIRRWEVLNAAFRGMSLPTVEQDLRLRIRRFRPAVVLYYPTPPQYLEVDRPRAAAPDTIGGGTAVHPWRALAPRFLGRLRDQARRALPLTVRDRLQQRRLAAAARRQPPGWRLSAVPRDRLAAYETDLRTLVGTIRAIGSMPVLATHANAFPPGGSWNRHYLVAWERFYPRAPASLILEFDAAARLATLAVARDSEVVVLDVADSLHARGDGLFADFAHFTDAGAGVVAGMLASGVADALQRAGRSSCR